MVMDVIDPNEDVPATQRLENLHQARVGQKRQYDKERYLQDFEEGQLVLIYRYRGYIGQTTKLRQLYEGPYRVIRKNSDLVYLVEYLNMDKNLRRPKEEFVHVSRMKPYHIRYSSAGEHDGS